MEVAQCGTLYVWGLHMRTHQNSRHTLGFEIYLCAVPPGTEQKRLSSGQGLSAGRAESRPARQPRLRTPPICNRLLEKGQPAGPVSGGGVGRKKEGPPALLFPYLRHRYPPNLIFIAELPL